MATSANRQVLLGGVLLCAAALGCAELSLVNASEDQPPLQLQSQAVAPSLPVVSDARLAGDAKRTRFVLDLDKTIEFRAFALDDPYRIVIDIPQVNFRLPPGSGTNGRGLVKAFRYGMVMPGGSRLVFDLTGPAKIAKQVEPLRNTGNAVLTTEGNIGAVKELGKLGRSLQVAAGGVAELRAGISEASDGAGLLALGAGRATEGARMIAKGLRRATKGSGRSISALEKFAKGARRLEEAELRAAVGAAELKAGLLSAGYRIEPLADHDRRGFDSGSEALDRYFRCRPWRQ